MVIQNENSRGVLYNVEGACFFKGGTGGREGGREEGRREAATAAACVSSFNL